MEYASNGKGNLGVTLGAIGTGLGAFGGSNILGGIFGGGNYVNKETFDVQLKLVDAQKDNALLAAELASEKKITAVRNEIMDRITAIDNTINANAASQAVINCGFSSANAVLQTQVAQLMSLTKLGIPNGSLMPGYGSVTVTPTTTGTTIS